MMGDTLTLPFQKNDFFVEGSNFSGGEVIFLGGKVIYLFSRGRDLFIFRGGDFRGNNFIGEVIFPGSEFSLK